MSAKPLVSLICVILLTLGATGAWLAWQPQLPAEANPAAQKVGVVNLGVVFKDYLRSQMYQADLKGKEKELAQEIRALEKKARKLSDERDMAQKGSPAREEKDLELQTVLLERKLKAENGQKKLQEQFEEYLGFILVDIEEVVQEYGSENDFDLILKAESGLQKEGEGSSFFSSMRYISARDVLYYNENRLDITSDIVKILNNRFARKQGNGNGKEQDR